MKNTIRLCSNYYSQDDLAFLMVLLSTHEIYKMKAGSHMFDYCGSTFNIWVDSNGDIILLNVFHEVKER